MGKKTPCPQETLRISPNGFVFPGASVWLLLQSMALVSRRSVSLAYREEDVVPSGNATTQSYLRCLEAALDHADPGFWAPPFWDCYLSKWVFGYTIALPGQRLVHYSLFFNCTEQQTVVGLQHTTLKSKNFNFSYQVSIVYYCTITSCFSPKPK